MTTRGMSSNYVRHYVAKTISFVRCENSFAILKLTDKEARESAVRV